MQADQTALVALTRARPAAPDTRPHDVVAWTGAPGGPVDATRSAAWWQEPWVPLSLAAALGLALIVMVLWSRRIRREVALRAHSEALSVRRRAEAELALGATERQLRQLIQSVKAIVWRMDVASARFTFVSQEAEDMLGYSTARWVDEPSFLESIQHPDDREWVSRHSRRATAECRDHSMDYRVFAQDGRLVWLRNIVTVVVTDGQPVELIGVMTDISEYKAAEEALEAAHAQALAATRAKSEFLASMSHEIRTPMNAVVGLTGILLDSPLQADQRQLVETVRASGEALLGIINDILDFSKVESGKLQLETIPFNIGTVAEEVVHLMAERAVARSLELTCLVENDVPGELVGDPGRVRQVLLNLVGNALKFTERGEVAVRVTLQHQSAAQAVVRCEVRDTGLGVPRDVQARLFEAFTQADASTTRRYGGTGLGLAISRRMVELMGGNIGVDSDIGQGSTFWFVVPFGRVHGRRTATRDEPSLHGTRALVVDDRATSQAIVVHFLSRAGIETEVVDTAAAAVAALGKGTHVDLAVIDEDLPDSDGSSLVTRLRAERAPGLPIVLLTTRLIDAPLSGEARVVRVIKPVRRKDLMDAVGHLLLTGVPLGAAGRAAVPDPSMPDSGEPKPAKASDGEGAPRVLVAEDNVVNQKVARLMLEREGCAVDVVDNGEHAVHALQRSAYDIVLMDCQMPVADGFEATRRIRALPGQAACTPIVALTANALAGDRDRCLAAGMDDYLSKPVRREALDAVLTRWIPSRRTPAA
jgi:two-component system, sensor histidine kinase and response regulator